METLVVLVETPLLLFSFSDKQKIHTHCRRSSACKYILEEREGGTIAFK